MTVHRRCQWKGESIVWARGPWAYHIVTSINQSLHASIPLPCTSITTLCGGKTYGARVESKTVYHKCQKCSKCMKIMQAQIDLQLAGGPR